jgi:hypothetical protein
MCVASCNSEPSFAWFLFHFADSSACGSPATPPLYVSVLSVSCSIKCQQAIWSQFRFSGDRYYFDYFATSADQVCLSVPSPSSRPAPLGLRARPLGRRDSSSASAFSVPVACPHRAQRLPSCFPRVCASPPCSFDSAAASRMSSVLF